MKCSKIVLSTIFSRFKCLGIRHYFFNFFFGSSELFTKPIPEKSSQNLSNCSLEFQLGKFLYLFLQVSKIIREMFHNLVGKYIFRSDYNFFYLSCLKNRRNFVNFIEFLWQVS